MKSIAPFLVVVVLLTGCQTNTFTHKHFPERVAQIHSVGLLPAKVHTAMLNKIAGKEPFEPLPEEPQIRPELAASTIDQLQRRGFTVKESSLQPELPGFTNQIWNMKMKSVYFSLPLQTPRPEAKMLAEDMDVDALVFLNVSAYKSTERRQNWAALNNTISILAAMGGSGSGNWIPFQEAAVQITLVDGKTGDVLWMVAENFGNLDTNRPVKAVAALFDRYPKQKHRKSADYETQTAHPRPALQSARLPGTVGVREPTPAVQDLPGH